MRGGASSATPPTTVPQTAHILQPVGRDRQRIVVQHDEVGEFSGLDAADQMIHLQGVGRADRDGGQRLLDGERLGLAPSTRPPDDTRLTAHQAVNSGANGVTGASEWIA